MARRPIPPKPTRPYEYETIEECEESGKLHRAEVKTWPPPRSRAGEPNPFISTRCTRCGGHLLVYGDNDPDNSGVEVIVLEKAPAEKGGDLHAAQGSKGRV